MVVRITKEQVEHVADLARLAFTDEEIAVFTKDLGDIIAFAEQLNELDTDGIEETTHVLNIANVMRPDEVRESISREEALLNAPDKRDGQVRVPNILEG